MSITRITIDSIEELKRISNMSDEESEKLKNREIFYDEENPKLTKEQLAEFKRVNPIKKEI